MIISKSTWVVTSGIIFSFLWLSDVPLYKCTTSSLCLHLLMDSLLASWRLKVLLQWRLGGCFGFSSSIFPRVGLLIPQDQPTADPVGTVISFLRNLHNVLCSDSYQFYRWMHLLTSGLSSQIVSSRVLNRVPCAGQEVLVDYLLQYRCSYIYPTC